MYSNDNTHTFRTCLFNKQKLPLVYKYLSSITWLRGN